MGKTKYLPTLLVVKTEMQVQSLTLDYSITYIICSTTERFVKNPPRQFNTLKDETKATEKSNKAKTLAFFQNNQSFNELASGLMIKTTNVAREI